MKRCLAVLTVVTGVAILAGCGGDGGEGGDGQGSTAPSWSVGVQGSLLQAGYGSNGDFPQYVALHLDSGYFRMVYGRDAGWGTSVIVPPSLWSGGRYFQGTPVTAGWNQDGSNLVISLSGTIGGVNFQAQIVIEPPAQDRLTASVSVTTSGQIVLDSRPGEAFKPVMLSSMHISEASWDTRAAFVEAAEHAIPKSGWVLQPPVTGRTWGLVGGTSDWKTNAPTVEVTFDRGLPVTGWITQTSDPNDDNVGFWTAADTVLASWSYTFVARR